MKDFVSRGRSSVLVACLASMPAFLLAGTPDSAANLSACKDGAPSCVRSRLTLVEVTQVALAGHARNVLNCRNGLGACDQRRLNGAEAIAVAVAVYDRNVSNCHAGLNPCDHSRLTGSEARDVALSAHQRQIDPSTLTELEGAAVARAGGRRAVPGNTSDCQEGRASCVHSLLSRSQAEAVARAERVRNYSACLNLRGYCDRSRLTATEAAAVPPEVRRTRQ